MANIFNNCGCHNDRRNDRDDRRDNRRDDRRDNRYDDRRDNRHNDHQDRCRCNNNWPWR